MYLIKYPTTEIYNYITLRGDVIRAFIFYSVLILVGKLFYIDVFGWYSILFMSMAIR